MKTLLIYVNSVAYLQSHREFLMHHWLESGYTIRICDTKLHCFSVSHRGSALILSKVRFSEILANIRNSRCVVISLVALLTFAPLLNLARDKTPLIILGGLGRIFSDKRYYFVQLLSRIYLNLCLSRLSIKVLGQTCFDAQKLRRFLFRPFDMKIVPGAGISLYRTPDSKTCYGPPLRVLMASRAVEQKGFRCYLEASKISKSMENANNLSFTLMLSNVDTADLNLLEHEYGDSCSIFADASRSTVFKFMRAADLVCLPSIYGEGIPRVLLEALAHAVPVLAVSRNNGCDELIRNSGGGFLIDRQDPMDLANYFLELGNPINSRILAIKGRAGYNYVAKYCGEKNVIRAVTELLH